MTNDKIQQLTHGLQTAFIDQTITSNLAYKPQFVSNNYKEGRKVISSRMSFCHAMNFTSV